ncbi:MULTISPECIES: GNAT family N-acetyltransferase [unclassified Clostridium]|uniref:GNAT family N-acetyltransferase n=1 Tax=unclassified Clostridium TaxID=2614128 RepID=UPI0025BB1E03|nr:MULTISPECIES: GNAT family N-acetyltransferase [unclassified Clostridium]
MNFNLEASIMDKSELKECANLMVKVFSDEPWFDKWESIEHAAKYLKEFMDNAVFIGFVVKENDSIVGACFGHTRSWYEGKEYYIDEYFIDSNLQNSGVGSKLMSYIKEYLASRNIQCIVLITKKRCSSM